MQKYRGTDSEVAKMKVYSDGYEHLVDMHNGLFRSAFDVIERSMQLVPMFRMLESGAW